MSERRPLAHACALIALALVVAATIGCDDSNRPLELRFLPADSVPAPNMVRLVGTVRTGQLLTIDVVVDGPTTSADLTTFDFGVLIGDGTIVEWVPDSQTLGSALDATGCADVSLFASPVGDDRAVTVAKIGCAGNRVLTSGTPLLSFDVRVLRGGATTVRLGAVPVNDPPIALDSTPAGVPSIVFDPTPITVFGL